MVKVDKMPGKSMFKPCAEMGPTMGKMGVEVSGKGEQHMQGPWGREEPAQPRNETGEPSGGAGRLQFLVTWFSTGESPGSTRCLDTVLQMPFKEQDL